MKHARVDYQDRIVDLDEKIGAEEPVFLLRATDKHMVPMIDTYIDRLKADPIAQPEMVECLVNFRQQIVDWQAKNGAKTPDIPVATAGTGETSPATDDIPTAICDGCGIAVPSNELELVEETHLCLDCRRTEGQE